MRARPNDQVKSNVHKFKGLTNGKPQKVMDDPTLEGKNENEIGRIQPAEPESLYTEQLEANMRRRIPSASIASSRHSVPLTLLEKYGPGRPIESPTGALAARSKTAVTYRSRMRMPVFQSA